MALNTLKCGNCNIVICELLSYIQYKHDVMDKDSLIKMCDECFSDSEVESAKKLLFECVTTKQPVISRRSEGKKIRNLDDIVSFFMHDDTDIHLIPIFVARDLQKLPPTSIDHIDAVTLVKDVIKIKNELNSFKEMFATVAQLRELQSDLDNLKFTSIVNDHNNVNMRKRGGYIYDSGPYGLPHSINSDCEGTTSKVSRAVEEHVSDNESAQTHLSLSPADTAAHNAIALSVTHRPRNHDPVLRETVIQHKQSIDASADNNTTDVIKNQQCIPNKAEEPLRHNSNTFSDIVKNGMSNNNIRHDEWTIVQKKKKKMQNRVIGRIGKATTEPEMKFKAAEIQIPLFISNVDKETLEKDICDYIHRKTNDQITLHKISMKKERSYNAYKFFVNKRKLDMYLDDKLWPDGIKFCRFMHFKPNDPAMRSGGQGPNNMNSKNGSDKQ